MDDKEREHREMFWINHGIPMVFGGGLILMAIVIVIRLW